MGRPPRRAAARENRCVAASVLSWVARVGQTAEKLVRSPEVARDLAREAAVFLGIEGVEEEGAAAIGGLIERRKETIARDTEAGEAELMTNIAIFADLLRLEAVERDLLALFAAVCAHPTLQSLLERVDARSRHQAIRALAIILGHDAEAVRNALRPEAPLGRFGVLNVAGGAYDFSQFALLNDELERVLSSSNPTEGELLHGFFTLAPRSSLRFEDYTHLEPRLTTVFDLLRGAGAQGAIGVNVLFYGLVGTGKTELARTIAERLGWQAYEVKMTNRDGTSSTSDERMSSYTMAQRFLERKADRLIIFDELEDLLGEGGVLSRGRLGKLYFNRLLETNPVPTIWIANDIDSLGLAARRRFDFSIAFGTLPGIARRRVLERHLVGLGAPLKADLARRETLLPAQVAMGRKVARLASRQTALVEAVDASMKLLGQPTSRAQASLNFDLNVCNADIDVKKAAEAFQPKDARGLLCLYGPPGVGKSALAGYLADS